MGSVRIAALAAVAVSAITFGTANAADYPCPPPQPYGPPPPPHCLTPPPPPPIEEFGGWYIRGDIGMTNQAVKTIDNALFATAVNLNIRDLNFESGMLFGAGVGYRWNTWLRFDVTGEYRGEAGFHGLDTYTVAGVARFNNYTAKKSEWLFLANVYADLGTWHSVTPFVGAGLGFSRIGIHSFRDMGTDNAVPTLAFGESAYKWNFAWALHAGISWELTKHTTIELAYRYVYLGDGQSGDLVSFDGNNAIYNPMIFKGLDSHDLKLGLRYYFATNTGYQVQVPELLMRKF
jgi:opacity protein-like surface antigen